MRHFVLQLLPEPVIFRGKSLCKSIFFLLYIFQELINFQVGKSEAFFSRLRNRGGQNLAGCGNFSRACSFYCTAFSFYCTADARSDSENLQKFLKKWLFLDIFCSYYFKTNLFIFTIKIFCSL